MEIDIDQYNNLRLKKVYSGIVLETSEGNQVGICMRDDTLEINVMPKGKNTDNWWRVDMQKGTIFEPDAVRTTVIDPEGSNQSTGRKEAQDE